MKKIPIGIQAFSSLIEGGFVYLDKTDMIYNIANTKACYQRLIVEPIQKTCDYHRQTNRQRSRYHIIFALLQK